MEIETSYTVRLMTREDWRELAVEKFQSMSIIDRLRHAGAFGLPVAVQRLRIEKRRNKAK